MYGTLSFDKGDKRSSAEFQAFAPAHGRWQRQPACDECRIARAKCRERPSKNKCARCYGTNKACTYTSAKRRSRQPQRANEPTTPIPPVNDTGGNVEDDDGHGPGGPPPLDAKGKTPQGPQTSTDWGDDIPNFEFESFDIFRDSGADTPMDLEAHQHVNNGTDCVSESVNDEEELYMPDPDLASTPAEHNEAGNPTFSTLCDDSLSRLFLPTLQSSNTPSLNSRTPPVHAHHEDSATLSFNGSTNHAAPPQHGNDTHNGAASRTPTLAGLSDLIDVMQFALGPSISSSATPASNTCACLQNLVANLFGLRGRGANIQMDQFLLLFKQSMDSWRTVDACALACNMSRSLALLLLMNVQQLVALLADVASSINNAARSAPERRRPESLPIINMGSFTVEEEDDQRFIAQMLLAARIKELYSFVVKASSKMKAVGFDDVFKEYQHQIELLRRVFAS